MKWNRSVSLIIFYAYYYNFFWHLGWGKWIFWWIWYRTQLLTLVLLFVALQSRVCFVGYYWTDLKCINYYALWGTPFMWNITKEKGVWYQSYKSGHKICEEEINIPNVVNCYCYNQEGVNPVEQNLSYILPRIWGKKYYQFVHCLVDVVLWKYFIILLHWNCSHNDWTLPR